MDALEKEDLPIAETREETMRGIMRALRARRKSSPM